MSARYIYEHLFLAHIAFEGASGEFFELVRSKTPSPDAIDIIATIRPYDDPEVDKFYYRFRKIHSTIVHKTHIVYDMSYKKLQRYRELFIEPEWNEAPFVVDYKDLPDFFDMLHNYDGSMWYKYKFAKFAVFRADDNFWRTYDWFQDKFFESNPKEAGLFDLNRYYHRAF